MKKGQFLAWFLIIFGALWIFEGMAIVFIGLRPPNLWMLLCGIGTGGGIGYYLLLRNGWKMRKAILTRKA